MFPQRQQKRISMDPLTAARIQTVRDHMRLECKRPYFERRAVITALGLDFVGQFPQ